MSYQKPLIENYLTTIVALNHAWKAARDLYGDTSELSTCLRDLKTCNQLRLLWDYGKSGLVTLEIDDKVEAEPTFGIKIRDIKFGRDNADHIPKRVLERYFTEEELKAYSS